MGNQGASTPWIPESQVNAIANVLLQGSLFSIQLLILRKQVGTEYLRPLSLHKIGFKLAQTSKKR